MKSSCTLRLQSEHVKVELEGDAEFVRSCYQLIRPRLLEQLFDSKITRPNRIPGTPLVSKLPPERATPRGRDVSTHQHLWVYRCTNLYHKVSVMERKDLQNSPIGSFVHPWRLKQIVLEPGAAKQLQEIFPAGKTLWSELTTRGREQLR